MGELILPTLPHLRHPVRSGCIFDRISLWISLSFNLWVYLKKKANNRIKQTHSNETSRQINILHVSWTCVQCVSTVLSHYALQTTRRPVAIRRHCRWTTAPCGSFCHALTIGLLSSSNFDASRPSAEERPNRVQIRAIRWPRLAQWTARSHAASKNALCFWSCERERAVLLLQCLFVSATDIKAFVLAVYNFAPGWMIMTSVLAVRDTATDTTTLRLTFAMAYRLLALVFCLWPADE